MKNPKYMVYGDRLLHIREVDYTTTHKTHIFKCEGLGKTFRISKKRAKGVLFRRKPRRW